MNDSDIREEEKQGTTFGNDEPTKVENTEELTSSEQEASVQEGRDGGDGAAGNGVDSTEVVSSEQGATSVESEVEHASDLVSAETQADAGAEQNQSDEVAQLQDNENPDLDQQDGEAKSGDEQELTNPNFRWYVVHTYSGYEEKAKSSLLERIKNAKQESKFGEMIVPTQITETTTKTGKKRQVARTQFPGYMLVQMDLDDHSMVLVKDTPRITGFVGNQQRPRPLPDREVLRYTNPEAAAAEEAAEPKPEVLFEKGEGVKVIDGPFSNFDGIVDEVKPDKARLRVLVSIFGRETPVELAYNQVEKL